MIRRCREDELTAILAVINDAAEAYREVIPPDRWKEPYMAEDELRREIADGVDFAGEEEGGRLVGVMGIQEVEEVTLIRHAYVLTSHQGQGIGSRLLGALRRQREKERRLLIGTWADAEWAIRFYQKHGFALVAVEEKNRLLRRYWTIPERQTETSVVLAER